VKRFHVHIAVENIQTSIAFYSKLFGQQPAKQHDDYAQWMLDDPRVNFAISASGQAVGVSHFGFQVDAPEELVELKKLADSAMPGAVLDQGVATCCYAKSEKHWTIDPQGLAWEHFHTLSDVLELGNDSANPAGAGCIPGVCCTSNNPSATKGGCCD
jgi:catechol 2,3-dioxygenase-like lactoylglutathione lyase family enzyme